MHQADIEGELSEEDEDLRTICLSCDKIAGELVARFDLLKVGAGHRKWKSTRQALKSVWITNTLDEIAISVENKDSIVFEVRASVSEYILKPHGPQPSSCSIF